MTMRAGLYTIKKIDEELVLLEDLQQEESSYTFPLDRFSFNPAEGDVVEVWRDGEEWKTKYREEETGSAKSHALDFVKRLTERE